MTSGSSSDPLAMLTAQDYFSRKPSADEKRSNSISTLRLPRKMIRTWQRFEPHFTPDRPNRPARPRGAVLGRDVRAAVDKHGLA
jgi:hypothetical protein